MNVLFITPYPHSQAPSQRFRFEQYLDILENNEVNIVIEPFFSEKTYSELYKNSNTITKVTALCTGFFKRFVLLFSISKFDYIFIHREATPIGPPWFEFIAAKLLKKKIIYDFDDAIWLEDPEEKGTFLAILKWKSKVAVVCKWSNKVIVGNSFLAEFARNYNRKVLIIPTTVDTENYHNPELHTLNQNRIVTIGWTGTHSTLQYLDNIIPMLAKLEKEIPFKFQVIANKNPNYPLKYFEYVPWNKETEIQDLSKFDIGLMPLTNDAWSSGKCGFKLIQYLALEIPAVASAVGVNNAIIDDGVNGYLCYHKDDFYIYLKELIVNNELRNEMKKNAREGIINKYSVIANKHLYKSLFLNTPET